MGANNMQVFEVNLGNMVGKRLGVDAVPSQTGFVVESVREGGAINLWNHRNGRDPYCVRPGDHIVMINGGRCDAEMLQLALQSGRDVVLRIVRSQPDGTRGFQPEGVSVGQVPRA